MSTESAVIFLKQSQQPMVPLYTLARTTLVVGVAQLNTMSVKKDADVIIAIVATVSNGIHYYLRIKQPRYVRSMAAR